MPGGYWLLTRELERNWSGIGRLGGMGEIYGAFEEVATCGDPTFVEYMPKKEGGREGGGIRQTMAKGHRLSL